MKIEKEKFMQDYKTLTKKEMSEKYGGITRPTILRLVEKYGGTVRVQGRPEKVELI
jgi:hypothetical protein